MKIIFLISCYWLTQVSEEQIGGFLRMLLGILGASLSVNLWAGKGTIKASKIF